jgi:hypothetical protein
MNEDRRDAIILETLSALRVCPQGQCRVNVLKPAVDMSLRPSTLGSEFQDALGHAEAQGWIVGLRPPIGPVEWRLTNDGAGLLLTQPRR